MINSIKHRFAPRITGALACAVLSMAIVYMIGLAGPTLITGFSDNPDWVGVGAVDPKVWDCMLYHQVLIRAKPGPYFWFPFVVRGPIEYPMLMLGPQGLGVAHWEPTPHNVAAMQSSGVIPFWLLGVFLIPILVLLIVAGRYLIFILRLQIAELLQARRFATARCISCGYMYVPGRGAYSKCPECGIEPIEVTAAPAPPSAPHSTPPLCATDPPHR